MQYCIYVFSIGNTFPIHVSFFAIKISTFTFSCKKSYITIFVKVSKMIFFNVQNMVLNNAVNLLTVMMSTYLVDFVFI